MHIQFPLPMGKGRDEGPFSEGNACTFSSLSLWERAGMRGRSLKVMRAHSAPSPYGKAPG
ncbi:hypothetical protein GCM10023078_35680 [Gibbsiella greigii]